MDQTPKFLLIIGAAKSGTWTLASWLNSRPDMVANRLKEPRFFTGFAATEWTGPGSRAFARSIVRTEQDYLGGFPDKPGALWHIDASTDYLWAPGADERIRRWAGRFETRLIVILRDPAERAFSEYRHTVRDHLETGSFRVALEAEAARRRQNWQPLFYHLRRSRYAADLARYAGMFGSDLLIMDFAELADPAACMSRVEGFLGLASLPAELTLYRNKSFAYRSSQLDRIMQHDWTRRLAHRLLPAPLRRSLRRTANYLNRTEASGAPEDLAYMRTLLVDDLDCLSTAPYLPPMAWPSLQPGGGS